MELLENGTSKGPKRWKIVFEKLSSVGKEEQMALKSVENRAIDIKQLTSYLRSESSYRVRKKYYRCM